jgi:hypothetical protein
VPDAVPAVLSPSNSKVELDVPALDVPMPDVVPMLVLAAPKNACGIEPPMPPHVVRLLIVGGSGDVPDVIGLTPSVGTSVVPRRRPAGGTAEPGPMPSGDVLKPTLSCHVRRAHSLLKVAAKSDQSTQSR